MGCRRVGRTIFFFVKTTTASVRKIYNSSTTTVQSVRTSMKYIISAYIYIFLGGGSVLFCRAIALVSRTYRACMDHVTSHKVSAIYDNGGSTTVALSIIVSECALAASHFYFYFIIFNLQIILYVCVCGCWCSTV